MTEQRGDLTLALVRAADAEPVDGSKLATAAQVVLKEAELLLTDATIPYVFSTESILTLQGTQLCTSSPHRIGSDARIAVARLAGA